MKHHPQVPEFLRNRYMLSPPAISVPDSPQAASLILALTKHNDCALGYIHFQVILITKISQHPQHVLQLVFGVSQESKVICI
jgi:hypothetical protein